MAFQPAHEVVSMDALALVRFGLRDPNDLRIQNTLCAIDALLKVELENGPIWRRYNGDRFGENEDGLSFRKERKGIGRLWPLMIGERAHFELLRGRHDEASRLREAMANYATSTYLLPEQIWDADNIPEKGLIQGQPTGSVTPLLWAHGEYVKLLRSLRDGKVFDFPASP
jgi:glucoamylase